MRTEFPPARAYDYWLRRSLDVLAPNEWRTAWDWYDLAHVKITSVADHVQKPVSTVAAVFAALSPQCSWALQRRLTEDWIKDPGTLNSPAPYPTFGANRRKALAILLGHEQPEDVLGQKTRAFWRALMLDRKAVVIDTWMVRAAGWDPARLTPKRYERLQDALIAASIPWNHQDNLAAMQAVIWETVRRDWSKGE